jgi:hypothetical protein
MGNNNFKSENLKIFSRSGLGSRVTRLGEFLPVGRLFTFGSFLKKT